ncbi:pyridoxal-phosphate dependent enzyme [Prosthecochloris sp.]|uniref:pyridoxal-phosphate dependent enzyme n=1 Tax=Prosthecochloris sp. TaxID=290513 RepID=UPI0025D91B0E|nr:pyridoxal-phosphate dependent enzyme [Prosthecochloris sp.]
MYDHIADAMKKPAIIKLESNLFALRFETMKLYSTITAVERLLDEGRIDTKTTLIDSSSGLYAYALAMACHKHGLKSRIVASTTINKSLAALLENLGAHVEKIPAQTTLKLDQKFRVEKVLDVMKKERNHYWMRQYHDEIHYLGYEDVAKQIIREVGTENLTVVGAVGSGCSTGGITSYLRCDNEDVRLLGIEPFGSVTFGSQGVQDPDMLVAGIGSSIEFQNVRHELYDDIHWVSFNYSRVGAIHLLRDYAIFAGLSSGCAYLVARYEAEADHRGNYVFIMPDTGHRYIDAVFTGDEEVSDRDSLAPTTIHGMNEISLDWCTLNWNRRTYTIKK